MLRFVGAIKSGLKLAKLDVKLIPVIAVTTNPDSDGHYQSWVRVKIIGTGLLVKEGFRGARCFSQREDNSA